MESGPWGNASMENGPWGSNIMESGPWASRPCGSTAGNDLEELRVGRGILDIDSLSDVEAEPGQIGSP